MEIITNIDQMQSWSTDQRLEGRTIGFVPTMGFLHEGHLSLVRLAHKKTDKVVVSIFVNPMQFGPQEDLDQYPRDIERDLSLLSSLDVNAVFVPAPSQMYPWGFQTKVLVTEVTRGLCGAFRPDFFPGVATVVLKLLNIVQPTVAVFGQKDFQQLVTVRRLVKDLHLAIEIVGGGIVREPDGLAMSSRNTYLSPEERNQALSLSQALELAQEMVRKGERNPEPILAAVRNHITSQPLARLQYASLAEPETMVEVPLVDRPTLLALAVFIGRTRLIDNALLEPPRISTTQQ